MAIIDGKQRSADATVIEPSKLAVLSRESFLKFIRNNPVVRARNVERHLLAPASYGQDAATARLPER
jgi:CRP-like cAMP-binding protein